MGTCKSCKQVVGAIEMIEGYCPRCFAKINPEKAKEIEKQKVSVEDKKQNDLSQSDVVETFFAKRPKHYMPAIMVGLIGAFMMILGAFAPIISVPLAGGQNYFQNGQGDGVLMMLLGIISLVLIVARYYGYLIITGILGLLVLGYLYVSFRGTIREAQEKISAYEAYDPIGTSLGEVFVENIHIDWGFAVLLAASVMIIVASFLKEEEG